MWSLPGVGSHVHFAPTCVGGVAFRRGDSVQSVSLKEIPGGDSLLGERLLWVCGSALPGGFPMGEGARV